MANISILTSECGSISHLLGIIGEPARLQILFALGNGDACVCHLVSALHMRQASISQHLMVLRQAGMVSTQREGRHIFYRLEAPTVLPLLEQAAHLAGIPVEAMRTLGSIPVPHCSCPKCNPTLEPKILCKMEPKYG